MNDISREDALAHFGVKGQKWGVRKEDSTSSPKTKRTPEEKKAIAKKVAIGTAVLVAAAGTAYAVHHMNKNGKLPMKSLSSGVKKAGEKATQKVLDEPTRILHFSKPTHSPGDKHPTTLRFIQSGGVKDADAEMMRASGGKDPAAGLFERYGINKEKIYAVMADPQGRRDAAGRPITHDIVIPRSMTPGINSIDDVREHIWPILQYDYEEMNRKARVS